jgi:uncharacterized protein affecting Mg2+/Co2+ transport
MFKPKVYIRKRCNRDRSEHIFSVQIVLKVHYQQAFKCLSIHWIKIQLL